MDLKYNNENISVEVEIKDNQVIADINGEKKSFSTKIISDNIISMFIKDSSKNIYSAEDDNNIYVSLEGESFVFEKVKDEEKSFDGQEEGSGDRQEVLPPMPGSIVKVLVEKGQTVEEGEALIIVEAMKMETSLYAALDGIVTEINVEAGEQVDSDIVLIVVEKNSN
ncbi:biotin/lipoyl-containing protein [Bacteroidota bacterium]